MRDSFKVRNDIILKSILREMRSYHKKNLNGLTHYNKKVRHEKKSFYEACLTQYVKDIMI
jgi:hypothetical protein